MDTFYFANYLPTALSRLRYAPTPIVRATSLGLSSSLDAQRSCLPLTRGAAAGASGWERGREKERERKRREQCTDLPIRGVKRSVSGPKEYPAERSTPRYPRAWRAPRVSPFLRFFLSSTIRRLSFLLPASRRLSEHRGAERAPNSSRPAHRLIAQRVKGTGMGKCDVGPLFFLQRINFCTPL